MSYGEYLARQQQRLQKFVDTRPHRDAGHQTEVVKRLAASAVLESLNPVNACVTTLNAPSTLSGQRTFAKAHRVQDCSSVLEFVAGQDVAAISRNPKPPRITEVCYSSNVIQEVQDKLRIYPQLSALQVQKNALQNCCRVCGEPAQFASGCACAQDKSSKRTPT